ncbi:MAG: Hsp20/alpha crystallin family protein [Acidimicrobiia bacterium]
MLAPNSSKAANRSPSQASDRPRAGDPEDVDLSIENNTLTVTASRRIEDLEDVNWLLRERPTGHHSRQVRLADSLDTGKVGANYDNSVLTVTVPMREESKPRKVSIEASNREAISAAVSS